MIVRCSIILDHRGDERGSHPVLAVGDVLVVLEIVCSPGGEPKFRVVNPERLPKDRMPLLWPTRMFEVLDPAIPSNWEAHLGGAGYVQIAPRTWERAGFWEDLSDWSPLSARASEDYDRELAVILAESKRLDPGA